MTTALAAAVPTEVIVPEDDGSTLTRRCIVRGIACDRRGLVRFVVDPEGEVVPDVDERLPGRGLWLSADRETLRTAVRRNAFSRAARRPVRVPSDIEARLELLLLRRCRDDIGLALRAGRAVFGFEKVRERLSAGRTGVLIEATDGAPGDRAKLRALAGGDSPVVDTLTGDELGAALGRDRVVHGLMSPGALANRLVRDASRLAGLRCRTEGRPRDHSTWDR